MGVKDDKMAVVNDIAERLARSKATVVTDYRGLNVTEITDLRRQLREAGIDYKVLKNTLSRRAADQAAMPDLHAHLLGPTAIAFGYDDPVAPAKIINEFARRHRHLKIKGGVLEGQVIGAAEVGNLASLPSREGLLSMLLSVLQAPVRNLAYAIKQIADQQEAGSEVERA